MAHPNGEIRVEYTGKNGGTEAIVSLPAGVSGTLILGGQGLFAS
jgi:hypothetical protein